MRIAAFNTASRILLFVHRPSETCRSVTGNPRSAYSLERETLAAWIRLGKISTAGISNDGSSTQPPNAAHRMYRSSVPMFTRPAQPSSALLHVADADFRSLARLDLPPPHFRDWLRERGFWFLIDGYGYSAELTVSVSAPCMSWMVVVELDGVGALPRCDGIKGVDVWAFL